MAPLTRKLRVLRATSRAKGKSKAQVAVELLVGSSQRMTFVRAPSPDEKDGPIFSNVLTSVTHWLHAGYMSVTSAVECG